MPPNDKNKLNRIEELKSKLFSRNSPVKLEHRDTFSLPHTAIIPDSWDDASTKLRGAGGRFFSKTSFFKKFFIFSTLFFLTALGYASYMFFNKGNTVSNENIDISILGNAFTAGGEELPLQIGITNRNNTDLNLVDLVVEYPKNSSGSLASNTERLRQSLGTIGAGSIRNENVKVVLYGEQGSVRPIKVSIEYRVEGSNAIFVKEKPYDVTVSSTPINLVVSAPASVSPNQEINLNVKATLNATNPASNVLLRVDYPVGFQFEGSSPAPAFGNNVWNLGDLMPGVDHNVSIRGKMVDVFDGEEKVFHLWSGLQSPTDKTAIGVLFNSMGQTVEIKKPSIEASLYINGVPSRIYATDAKSTISADIRYVNNLDTKITDLEIRAKISGNAVNRKTIKAEEGFYDSLNNVIIWDKTSIKKFSDIDPGDAGSVSFSVTPSSLFNGVGGLLSDPSIKIEIDVAGKQAVSGYELKKLTNSETAVIQIISDVGLAAKALHFSGPLTNTGPVPPKVEKETTYTITWSITNTANNVSKAAVVATLPTWVRFVGPYSPANEDVIFNPSSKEVTWNVGTIPKGTDISGPSRQVSFTVGLTPSLSQLATPPVLINEAVLTGHDDFANVEVKVKKSALNTLLTSDSAFPPGGEMVVE